MHPDPAGEYEFHAREAHTVVGNLCELENPLRVCDVHHDARIRTVQLSRIDLSGLVVEDTLVDAPHLSLAARDRDGIPGLNGLSRVLRTHDGRYPELAGDDRRMRGASAALRHYGRGHLHDRLPVWVCDLRDEHLASAEALDLAGVL